MDDIDVKKLERLYLESDSRLSAQISVIDNLRDENKHLRQVIEMLITSKSPTI